MADSQSTSLAVPGMEDKVVVKCHEHAAGCGCAMLMGDVAWMKYVMVLLPQADPATGEVVVVEEQRWQSHGDVFGFIEQLLRAERLPCTLQAWCELCALLRVKELGFFYTKPGGLVKLNGVANRARSEQMAVRGSLSLFVSLSSSLPGSLSLSLSLSL